MAHTRRDDPPNRRGHSRGTEGAWSRDLAESEGSGRAYGRRSPDDDVDAGDEDAGAARALAGRAFRGHESGYEDERHQGRHGRRDRRAPRHRGFVQAGHPHEDDYGERVHGDDGPYAQRPYPGAYADADENRRGFRVGRWSGQLNGARADRRAPRPEGGYSGGGYGSTDRWHVPHGEHDWRLREGGPSHRGKGPKDYTRSDDAIRADVCDCFTDDSQLDASDIVVEVRNCEVTLSGTVPDRGAKRHAEDLAETTPGVRQVQNNLRVAEHRTGGNPVSATGNTHLKE